MLGLDCLKRSWTTRDESRTLLEIGRPTIAIGPEPMLGTVTDRSSQDNHAYYMLGVAVSGSVPFAKRKQPDSEFETQYPMRSIEYVLGVYYGAAEFPDWAGDGTSNEIENHRGFPRFVDDYAFGVRADLHLPIGESGYIVLSGRMYDDASTINDVTPWSLMVGVTVPINSISRTSF